jgi:hypothetical protein
VLVSEENIERLVDLVMVPQKNPSCDRRGASNLAKHPDFSLRHLIGELSGLWRLWKGSENWPLATSKL